MRILIAGDMHANRHHAQYIFQTAKAQGCSLILQVGDLGFWPRSSQGIRFLERLEDLCREFDMEIWWLDGNHEDHDYLDALLEYDKERPLPCKSAHGIYPHVKYLPRGFRFELDGITFMSYGGAFSIDRGYRTKFKSWFPGEVIDLEHIRSLPDEHVDVLLSHDVPTGFAFPYDETSVTSIVSKEARDALYLLVQKTTPLWCYGGHHHCNGVYGVRHPQGWARAEILNCDDTGKASWTVVDTEQCKADEVYTSRKESDSKI